MGSTELSCGPTAEETTLSGRAPSLAPAVDITFSKAPAPLKDSKAGLRFRKLRQRGQSLLSRSSKAGRPDKTLAAQNDSSTTAVPAAADTGAYQGGRSASRSTHSPAISQSKGAADFHVAGKVNAPSNNSSNGNHLPLLSERRLSESGMAPTRSASQQRKATKLVRNPRNTQSMDVDRTHAREHRPRPSFFSQLFSCCSPVSLFSRSPSYGSMRNDARRQQQSEDLGAGDRESVRERQQQQQRQDDQGQGRQSAADTAVAGESAGDDLNVTPKIGPAPEQDARNESSLEAEETDWLMARPKAAAAATATASGPTQSARTDDYASAGSGLAGGVSMLPAPAPAPAPVTDAPRGSPSTTQHLAPPSAVTQQTSEFGTYNTAYSDLDTDAGGSSMDNSVYRTPPTSVGELSHASNSMHLHGLDESHSDMQHVELGQGTPSETPANTMGKLYMQTESTGRISRQLTLDSAADHDSLDDDDVDSDEENGLRAEITSPPGNIATVSSERLVTHVINQYLLPPVAPHLKGKKCLVLDLDETLVHSSFREVDQPDYVVPVVLEGQEHNVYVVKRPGVDEFMRVMGEHYEIVVFTASLSMYADPVLDLLDKSKVVHHRLFRESCNLYGGNYVKDLSRLGRDVSQSIIIDNSPASYAFHPNNAIGISTWLNDMMDTELRDLIPFLIDLTKVEDVSAVLSITHNHAS